MQRYTNLTSQIGESSSRMVALDFYRFVAAFGIVVFHVNQFTIGEDNGFFRYLTMDFDLFVDFFFVLSGFVIGFGYADKVRSTKEILTFLRRRLARIYPLYFVTTLCFIGLFAFGFSSHPESYTTQAIVAQLSLVQQWQLNPPLPFNFPAWSISAEWAMYFAFPMLIYFYRRSNWVLFVLIVGGSSLLLKLLLYLGELREPVWSALRSVPTFTLGVWISQVPIKATLRHGELLGLIAFLGAVLSMLMHLGPALTIVLFSLTIALTFVREAPLPCLNSHWLERLGDCSYSLYLLHAIVFTIFYKGVWPHLRDGPPPLPISLTVALCIVPVSYVVFSLFERPSRAILSGSLHRKTIAVGPVSGTFAEEE